MARVREIALSVGRFIGISLLVDLGLLLVVVVWCLLGTSCTSTMYSERMFWLGMATNIAAMPAIVAGLNSQRGYFNSPFTAGQDAKVYGTIINDAHRQMSTATKYFWRMASIGVGAIAISALIDILGR